MPTRRLDERVDVEIQDVVFKNAYVGIAGGALALLGLFLMNSDQTPRYIIDRWCLALAFCLFARMVAVGMNHFHKATTKARSSLPFNIYYAFSVIEGFVWGSAMFAIFPADVLEQAFLMIVLIGIAVGGMATFSGSMSLYAIYVCSILGLVFVKLFSLDKQVYNFLAMLTPVLLTVLLVIARRLNTLILDTLRLGFKNEQLALIESASKQSIVDFSKKLSLKTQEVEAVTNRLKKLVTILSRDIRTHLVTLCQFSRFLGKEKASTQHDHRFIVETLQRSAESGLQLVEDLLEITGVEPEAITVDLSDTLIQGIIENAMKRVQSLADDKGVKIYVAVDEPRPVRMDAKRIEEVIATLIDTAVTHTPAEGSVTVQTTPTQSGLRVEIIDSGQVFPTNELTRLFAKNQGQLSITEEIIKAHDSHIEVKNNAPVGTCFSFTLPWSK
ncbi:MAG: HAMP domain-containing sensor histidine kinase [Chlamydiales bacterium]|nr:HAMP domain-containing sensor histidine kinase [Chlamydiales bacterium]